MSVGHGLKRRESLGRDNEKGLCGIEVADGFRKVRAINVGNKPEGPLAVAVVLQRFVGHDRPEVGAADADVNDIANGLAGVPFPLPAAHAVGEACHLFQHGMHLGHHVLAVDDDGCPFGSAQGDVQHRPLLRDVDLLSAEHGFDARTQTRFLGQADEKLEGLDP